MDSEYQKASNNNLTTSVKHEVVWSIWTRFIKCHVIAYFTVDTKNQILK